MKSFCFVLPILHSPTLPFARDPLPLSRPSRHRHRLHARVRLARGGREVLPLQRRPGRDPDRGRVRVSAAGGDRRRWQHGSPFVALVVARGGDRPLLGDDRPGARLDPSGDRRGRPCVRGLVALVAQALAASQRRGADAGDDGRQLSQLGGAARRRLHGDDPRPLVSRHSVAAGVAPAVDRQAAHRLDGRSGSRWSRPRCSSRSSTLAARARPELPALHPVGRAASSSGSGCCSAWPGPALLSYLTWETAKIRSTQSATGILYVDFFTVVVGEVLAKYLLLATRVPV